MSLILSRRDLTFLLHEWLAVERLTERPRYADGSRDLFDEALALAERVATDRFAPHNREADANEPFVGEDGRVVLVPAVAEALRTFSETGLVGTSLPELVGGMQLPHVIQSATFAWFQAANVATSAYPFLTLAAANMLIECGSPEQIETWVRPMVEGRYFGTMCLSETQAGSSLADITTAEPHLVIDPREHDVVALAVLQDARNDEQADPLHARGPARNLRQHHVDDVL
jgi:alkylation response protein AidB-like acyl-CoA dehydrogenase